MNVGELKKLLETFPDEMQVIHTYCSDYRLLEADDFSVRDAVNTGGGWLMRAHKTMSVENKAKCQKYLHIKGN